MIFTTSWETTPVTPAGFAGQARRAGGEFVGGDVALERDAAVGAGNRDGQCRQILVEDILALDCGGDARVVHGFAHFLRLFHHGVLQVAGLLLRRVDGGIGPLGQRRMLAALVILIARDAENGAEQKKDECFHGDVG
ncbi:MAG: hypothetical protein WDM96_06460 [Lacunisphaera sp.]